MSALVARGLGWRVAGRDVLRGVDLTATPGRVVGVIGPNGAGKSTAFALIAGERDGAGTVALLGRDVSAHDLPARARAGLGYLPQGAVSLRGLRAREQLAVLGEARGLRGRELRTRVEGVLDAVGLGARAEVRVESLSGGERRRLEVGGVLLARCPVMVLDEPFAGVEPRGVATLAACIREACVAGAAVLLSDHSRETLGVCDEAVLLVAGEVRLVGSATAVRDDTVVREAYFGRGHDSDAKSEPRV